MRAFDKYILSLTILFLSTTVILAIVGEERLDLYFAAYLIEYLLLTLVFAHLHPKARRALNFLSFFLFIGFGLVVVSRLLEILLGFALL
jgi:succinate-acetate transporter protein